MFLALVAGAMIGSTAGVWVYNAVARPPKVAVI